MTVKPFFFYTEQIKFPQYASQFSVLDFRSRRNKGERERERERERETSIVEAGRRSNRFREIDEWNPFEDALELARLAFYGLRISRGNVLLACRVKEL